MRLAQPPDLPYLRRGDVGRAGRLRVDGRRAAADGAQLRRDEVIGAQRLQWAPEKGQIKGLARRQAAAIHIIAHQLELVIEIPGYRIGYAGLVQPRVDAQVGEQDAGGCDGGRQIDSRGPFVISAGHTDDQTTRTGRGRGERQGERMLITHLFSGPPAAGGIVAACRETVLAQDDQVSVIHDLQIDAIIRAGRNQRLPVKRHR